MSTATRGGAAVTGTATPRRRSPRQRARNVRIVQYVVLAAVLLALVLVADWHQVGQTFFRSDLMGETLRSGLGRALLNTVIYTIGAFCVGLVLGTTLALMKLSQVAPYRWLATAYVEFFRGLPALIVLIAFGLLPIAFPGLEIPGGTTGTVSVGLGMVSGAYMCETIRAGILAVPKGQVEAARSLGMSPGTATRKIVLPQAFRIILPPLTNELILLVKDTSLVYILGLGSTGFELTKFGRELSNQTANLTPLVMAGFCYLLITLPLTLLVRRLEAKNAKAR